MRFIFYGAGAIAGNVGAYLTRAGCETILIGFPSQVKTINQNGLHMISAVEDFTVQPKAVTGPDQITFKSDDVLCLAVKSQVTEEVLTNLKKYIDDIPIFCFQNGVTNEEMANRFFPRVYGVMIMALAVSMKDGEAINRTDKPGILTMGKYPHGIDPVVQQVAKATRDAGYMSFVTTDIMLYKWEKLLVNLGNAVGAITNAQGKDIEFITESAHQEAENILKKAGVQWISPAQIKKDWPETATWPNKVIQSEATSSTWQSLGRGESTVETDYLNGEIVKQARKLGLKAPINEKITSIITEMAINHQKPGRYTPAELIKVLGLKKPANS